MLYQDPGCANVPNTIRKVTRKVPITYRIEQRGLPFVARLNFAENRPDVSGFRIDSLSTEFNQRYRSLVEQNLPAVVLAPFEFRMGTLRISDVLYEIFLELGGKEHLLCNIFHVHELLHANEYDPAVDGFLCRSGLHNAFLVKDIEGIPGVVAATEGDRGWMFSVSHSGCEMSWSAGSRLIVPVSI